MPKKEKEQVNTYSIIPNPYTLIFCIFSILFIRHCYGIHWDKSKTKVQRGWRMQHIKDARHKVNNKNKVLSNKSQKSTRNQQKRAEDLGQKEQKMEDAGPTT